MVIIYRKTAKGLDEIQTRAYRLPPRARSALILVDGLRSDADLAKLIQVQAAETLAMLRDQGFVEVVAEVASAPVAVAVAASVARPTPSVGPAGTARAAEAGSPVDVAESRPRAGFQVVRREAVKRMTDLVGPTAEPLAIRMERANDLDTLRPLVMQAHNLIASVRGQRVADDYLSTLSAM